MPRRALAIRFACLLAIAVALTWQVDGYPLLEPDEGRNAEIMREMAATNGYILPHLNGLPYVDKPVLYFAAGAAAMEIAGPTEKAARFPSLLFTIGTLILVAWFGHRLFGPEGAWTAAVATAASPLTIAYARTVIFDAALTFWICAALFAFFLATESPHLPSPDRGARGREQWWAAAGWVALALAVLTKGPVALVFVLLVALPYAIWRRRPRALLDPIGLLTFVAVILPWVLAVSNRVPEFLEYVFVVETFGRLTTDALGRGEAIWYFFPILAAAALPWTVAAVIGWRRGVLRLPNGGVDRRTVFLLLWIAVPLLFFTLSQSKRPQYILPLVPAVALLVARVWHAGAGVLPGARAAGGALLLAGGFLVTRRDWIPTLFDTRPEVAAAIPPTALWLGLLAALAGSAVFALADRRHALLLALGLPVLAIPVVGMPLMRAIGADRSHAELAGQIEPLLTDETQIVGVGAFPLSLPFYLERTITLATPDAEELTSNYVIRYDEALRAVPGSPLRPAEWWREALALCDRPRLFVVGRENEAARREMERRLPLRAESRKVAAYGPCGGDALARTD